jgi:hypothetical protein
MIAIGREAWRCSPLIAATQVETAVMVLGGLLFVDRTPSRTDLKRLDISHVVTGDFVVSIICAIRGDGRTSVEFYVETRSVGIDMARRVRDDVRQRGVRLGLSSQGIGFGAGRFDNSDSIASAGGTGGGRHQEG